MFLHLSVILFMGGWSLSSRGICPGHISVRGGISVTETPRYSGRPGGTHPTGVHSRLSYFRDSRVVYFNV